MKYNIFFLFIPLLFNISCSKNIDLEKDVKTIHLKESKDILPISTFIKSLDYLELDVSSVNIEIGEMVDLKILDNDILLKHQKSGTTNFLRFSKEGKFIIDLTKNRKGRVAIADPRDIVQYRKDFAVLGAGGIHIVSDNGTYKGKSFEGDMQGNTILYSNNKFFLIHETASSGFLTDVGDPENKKLVEIADTILPNNVGYSGVSVQGKENFHLFSYLNDTIFAFSNNTVSPKYIMNGNPYPTFIKVLQNIDDLDQSETLRYIHNTQYVVVKNYLENKNYIFITYWIGSNSCTVIINKKTWEPRYFARGVNNIDGGIWDKAFYLSENDELYIPISSYKISGHKISDKNHKEFEKLQEKIQISGNPVVMRCKLK